jgi:hypothetical protein
VTIMTRVYSLLACLTLANVAYAQDNPYLPEAKLKPENAATWNVGAGVTHKLLHMNVEWVNPYGIAYAKAGVFWNGDKEPGGQVGFRYPYHLTGTDQNGYYIGAYAGHIESKEVDGEDKARLGAGVDLSYVMLSKERISTFSVGIGAGEKLEDRYGNTVADINPKLQISYTLSIGL